LQELIKYEIFAQKGEPKMLRFFAVVLILATLLGLVSIALAQEEELATEESVVAESVEVEEGSTVSGGDVKSAAIQYFIWVAVICASAMAVAAVGAAMAQARAAKQALESVARQPEASGKIQIQMVLALVFIETLAIYTLVIALILLFANPFTESVVKMTGM